MEDREKEIKELASNAYDEMLNIGTCFVHEDGTRMTKEECVEYFWGRFNSEEYKNFK